jgi:hypothetical protein
MQSSISTPTLPALEYTWYGSLYMTAGFASMDPSVPPSSLYGPWVSSDSPGWNGKLAHTRIGTVSMPALDSLSALLTCSVACCACEGDMTLDYNQESQLEHVFASNHPELAVSYYGTILAWSGAPGRTLAAGMAKLANKTCSINGTATAGVALPGHIAPCKTKSNLYHPWLIVSSQLSHY